MDCRHTNDQLHKMLNVLENTKRSQDLKERQIKARAKIQEQRDEEIIELYELQKEALAKQLDEAKKRIAELEVREE